MTLRVSDLSRALSKLSYLAAGGQPLERVPIP
jgi:hypothetical protein